MKFYCKIKKSLINSFLVRQVIMCPNRWEIQFGVGCMWLRVKLSQSPTFYEKGLDI